MADRSDQTDTNSQPDRLPPLPAGVDATTAIVIDAESLTRSQRGDWFQSVSLPHLGWALFWVIVIFSSQIGFGVVWEVGRAVATGGRSLSADGNGDQSLVFLTPAVAIVYTTLTMMLTSFAVAGGLFRGDIRRRLGIRGVSVGHAMLVSLFVLPLAVVASEVTNWAAELLPQLTTEIFEDFGQQSWGIVFIGACLFPGIGEEILFRGFLGRGLVARHGLRAGVAWTSLLFGLIHVDPVQGCGAVFLGLGLHGVFLATRSLAAPILLHTLNNALAFAAIKYADQVPIPGVTPSPEGDAAHVPWYLLLAAGVAALGCGWMIYQTRARWLLPSGCEWTPGYPSGEMPPAELRAELSSNWPSLPAAGTLVMGYLSLLAALYGAYAAALK